MVLCKGAGSRLKVSMALCPSRAFPSLLGAVEQPLCGAALPLGPTPPVCKAGASVPMPKFFLENLIRSGKGTRFLLSPSG